MEKRSETHSRRTFLTAVAAGALLAGTAGPAAARPARRETDGKTDGKTGIADWIDRHAAPLTSTDPRDPIGDLRALCGIAAGATVVGLGESTHGSREQFRVKHRMVRFLVERMDVRTVGFELDFTHGTLIDRYVVTGAGDPRALVKGMGFPFWVCEEILDLVTWMRSYNRARRDKVRFLGTDLTTLRPLSFDEVTRYVREYAPDRLEELERLLTPLRPTRPNQFQWYQELPPGRRQELIAGARRAGDLVHALSATAPQMVREYAEQHMRTILGWYETYNHLDFAPERELFIADTIGWWQRLTGGKVAYWAADAHVTSAASVTYRHPDGGWTAKMAGGHLKDRLSNRYAAVGSVFGHGTISSNPMDLGTYPVGPPPAGLLDATLGTARSAAYLLDLGAPAPGPVRAWLAGPVTTRMILPTYAEGDDGSGYVMTVGSLANAFDALAYLRTTTASHLLP